MTELLIFAKAPRPGFVKTRLAQSIGPDEACRAYEILLQTLAHRIASVDPHAIFYSPSGCEPEIKPFFPTATRFVLQDGNDLGQRLLNAFQNSFAQGNSKTLIIGSDCPYLHADDIAQAFHSLDHADLVFGPAHDGGYWLVGARVLHPPLFEKIDWGTNQVLDQSLRQAATLGLQIHLLRTLSDIDTAEDWAQFQNQP